MTPMTRQELLDKLWAGIDHPKEMSKVIDQLLTRLSDGELLDYLVARTGEAPCPGCGCWTESRDAKDRGYCEDCQAERAESDSTS